MARIVLLCAFVGLLFHISVVSSSEQLPTHPELPSKFYPTLKLFKRRDAASSSESEEPSDKLLPFVGSFVDSGATEHSQPPYSVFLPPFQRPPIRHAEVVEVRDAAVHPELASNFEVREKLFKNRKLTEYGGRDAISSSASEEPSDKLQFHLAQPAKMVPHNVGGRHSAVLLSSRKSSVALPPNRFCLELPNGFYHHPSNCSRIIQCFGSNMFEYPPCQYGLVFNEHTGFCDYQRNVLGCTDAPQKA